MKKSPHCMTVQGSIASLVKPWDEMLAGVLSMHDRLKSAGLRFPVRSYFGGTLPQTFSPSISRPILMALARSRLACHQWILTGNIAIPLS